MIVDVSDKVVVITGSSKGIGSELAKTFAKENAKVVVNYCHSEKLAQKLLAEVQSFNSECLFIHADVTKPKDVSAMYHETIKTFGRVDILINNAGICEDNFIQMMPLGQWQRIIDVNLTGVFLCSREFSKAMIKQQSGRIINIASLKGQEGSAGQVNYSASKAGVIGFTKALAKELGPYNIAVNAVCPGFIMTDLNHHSVEKRIIAENRSLLPIDKTLIDLISFIIFASSEKFSCISGRVFHLDSRCKK
jgi:3-oxoacyl-[acyl-carrier protein] reductase